MDYAGQMSRMVNLDMIILTVMRGGPTHGYALKQGIEASYGKRYVNLSNSALYPRLAKMEADGYIVGEVLQQEKVPDRRMYKITPKGLEHLKELVAAPLGLREEKFDYKVRAVMFGMLTREERRKVTEPLYMEKLQEIKEAKAKLEQFGKLLDKYSLLVLEHGTRELELEFELYEKMMEME
jgi:PadR family transcriptional regulator, regulatory protein AphA